MSNVYIYRYLTTWFVMDMASTIPFEALAYFFTGKHQKGLCFSLLGLLRFWRIRRVKQFFTRFFNNPLTHHYIHITTTFITNLMISKSELEMGSNNILQAGKGHQV